MKFEADGVDIWCLDREGRRQHWVGRLDFNLARQLTEALNSGQITWKPGGSK